MTDGIRPKTAAMQGAGFYNRNSALQAANITTALPLLEEAASCIPIEGDAPLVIVDYGSSQGRNSLLPMRMALDILRARAGSERPIEVVHTDLPSNDFQSLFTLLVEAPESYLSTHANVFPSAVGRSYFSPILSPGRVDLGWSSNALHWMSRNPIDVPDHGWAVFSASKAARDAVDQQLAEDWRGFLAARTAELRVGAKLICQFMGRGPDSHGFEWMAGCLWKSLLAMGRDGLLSSDELRRMTCPSAGRSLKQIEDPFEQDEFADLSLTQSFMIEAPDPFWNIYCQTGDLDKFSRSWAMVMRAANGPNFAAALAPGRDINSFLDVLTDRLAIEIAADPQQSRSYMALVAVQKTGSTSL